MDTSEGGLYGRTFRCFLWHRRKIPSLDRQGESMVWEGKEDRRMNPHTCDSSTCQYHWLTENLIKEMKDAIVEIKEGQVEMRMTIVQLTQNVKEFDRIERRIDKLEEEQKKIDDKQDDKIDKNSIFQYKMIGLGVALMGLINLLPVFFGFFK